MNQPPDSYGGPGVVPEWIQRQIEKSVGRVVDLHYRIGVGLTITKLAKIIDYEFAAGACNHMPHCGQADDVHLWFWAEAPGVNGNQ